MMLGYLSVDIICSEFKQTVFGESSCSVVTMTFTSRDTVNHVLERVRHLVIRIVVFWSIACFLPLRSCYSSEKTSERQRTDYVQGQISEHIFAPN